MTSPNITTQPSQDEKAKVAFALNLCAVSISQIIDSKDIVVLKQERESILNNLNLQNFVKHPALLEVLKRILDTVTYLEIQAGDLVIVEKMYQHRLRNAIWSAIPSPGALIAGGSAVSLAIAAAAAIGTGYMNYRRNKSQYALDKDISVWQLKRHEIEQLYGLRAQLFETTWKLSADYDFDDKYRLSEKQLSRYSEALLEEDPLKRYERLDVMSDKFSAFPPFWYHKGNAAMEVFRDKQYSAFSEGYKAAALEAYDAFHKSHFEFLREDVIAASCCIEHISLLAPDDGLAEKLLHQALRLAGENYDVLQQSIFINLQFKKINEVILPLREMIANGYNVGLNGILLSRIYFAKSSRTEYDKLRAIAGEDNVLPWSDDSDLAEKQLIDTRKARIADEYRSLAQRIVLSLKTKKTSTDADSIYHSFRSLSKSLQKYTCGNKELAEAFETVENKLKQAVVDATDTTLRDFFDAAKQLGTEMLSAEFAMQIAEDAQGLINEMSGIAK
ncbi:MAG: hypothetical protein LBS00_11615 [Synergistaceae bacterium]|jgi:hypothetical protein|nr:hypothetical protein [Synergistaceae bacterium]